MTDPAADALRDLAADLAEDAAEIDVTDAHGGAVREGLGRAAGRAEQRATEIEADG